YPPSHWGYWKLKEQGIASYYGYGFYFRQTASGQRYWPWRCSAASLTLPLGTIAKVVNKNNGQSVYVEINDRGPYVNGRILDLSFVAALKLGMTHHGIVPVDIYTK
ncbi:MAG: septal ring lytic transglycosylase RlpA family protein, partial [Lentisphaerota bacterium]